MNYTKGEWTARKVPRDSNKLNIMCNETFIATPYIAYGQMEANAHLIAAAPEMYEALKAVTNTGAWQRMPEYVIKDIVKALAKAEGKP